MPDPRGREGQRHCHVAMLAALICATLCGFPGDAGAAQWIRLLPIEWWHQLGGRRNPPCENAFRNVMMVVCPRALEEALWRWLTDGLGITIGEEQFPGVVLDGKALRGTRARHQQAMMVVAALDQSTGCVLSQTPVDGETNEARTALAMLKSMVLEGAVILGDAAYCQQDVCKTITQNNGEYLVIVKDNQPHLHRAAQPSFVIPKDFSPLSQW
ncbi:MAG: ISAs1 family transposase [Planctomycetaceae bacterium]|nr:ISAs1 family transposase [Planctomycetaceae bacterium]